MSKKETFEKFLKFMEKWHYEDFNAFETHFNKLLSMKGREQLTNENEALKDSIAVILAQKKNMNEQINQLKQQLAEKQIEIDEINKEFVQAVHDLKTLCAEKDKMIANLKVLIIENKMQEFKIGDNEYALTDEDARNDIKCQIENQTQLAIQELEKVKLALRKKVCLMQNTEHCYLQRFISWIYICDQINKQIKELKEE